jgi:hypothetical protein
MQNVIIPFQVKKGIIGSSKDALGLSQPTHFTCVFPFIYMIDDKNILLNKPECLKSKDLTDKNICHSLVDYIFSFSMVHKMIYGYI